MYLYIQEANHGDKNICYINNKNNNVTVNKMMFILLLLLLLYAPFN